MFRVKSMFLLMLVPVMVTAMCFLWLAFLPNPMA